MEHRMRANDFCKKAEIFRNLFAKYFFIGLLILSSCIDNSDRDNQSILNSFKSQQQLLSTKYSINGGFVKKPIFLSKVDSFLILLDQTENYIFKIIDLEKKEIVKICGRRGHGPGEVTIPLSAHMISEREIGVNDYGSKKYYKYNFDSLLRGSEKYLPDLVRDFKLIDSISLITFSSINDNNIIATGIFPNESRYGILDEEMSLLTSKFEFPDTKEVSHLNKALAYQGKFSVPLKSNLAVYATQMSGIIEFMSFDGSNFVKLKDKHYYLPEYKVDNSRGGTSSVMKHENIVSFIDVFSNEKNVFTLYSGKTFKYFIDTSSSFAGEHILVYDWNGNEIMNYNLDQSVSLFYVDTDNKTIYGISEDSYDFPLIIFSLE